MDISDLSNKRFKIMAIKMIIKLRRMDEDSENFNQKIKKKIRKYKIEVKELRKSVSELKYALMALNCRLHEAEIISDPEDRRVEISRKRKKKV